MTVIPPHTFTVCYTCHRPLLTTDPIDLMWRAGSMHTFCKDADIDGCRP